MDLRSTTPSRDGHQDLTEDVVDHAWRRQRERAHYRTLQARNHDIPAPVDSPLIELEQELSDLVFRDLEEGGMSTSSGATTWKVLVTTWKAPRL